MLPTPSHVASNPSILYYLLSTYLSPTSTSLLSANLPFVLKSITLHQLLKQHPGQNRSLYQYTILLHGIAESISQISMAGFLKTSTQILRARPIFLTRFVTQMLLLHKVQRMKISRLKLICIAMIYSLSQKKEKR